MMVKRVAVFMYGAAAYLVFLASFTWAVGFVTGIGVPWPLDAPGDGDVTTALAVNAALLTLFAVQHSVMARPWFKRRLTRVVPPAAERSTFVLCASLALALLCVEWRPLGGDVWTVDQPVAATALRLLGMLGWVQVLVTTFLINHFDLFGLRQVWLFLIGRPYTRVAFTTPAPYRLVRHPLYLGFLVAFWATPVMTAGHLFFAVMTTAYIVVAIQFEEHDLAAEHGAAYERYRRSVPMIVPLPARSTPPAATDERVTVSR